jgi:hypothetical protein
MMQWAPAEDDDSERKLRRTIALDDARKKLACQKVHACVRACLCVPLQSYDVCVMQVLYGDALPQKRTTATTAITFDAGEAETNDESDRDYKRRAKSMEMCHVEVIVCRRDLRLPGSKRRRSSGSDSNRDAQARDNNACIISVLSRLSANYKAIGDKVRVKCCMRPRVSHTVAQHGLHQSDRGVAKIQSPNQEWPRCHVCCV